MRFLSLFSGIEAASSAWSRLGWQCAGVSEIDPFACAALAQKYPHAPNLGDVTKITEEQVAALGRLDVLIFGSPCQDLSVAGKGAGLAGARSGLFHDAIRIIRWARKRCGLRFALWENVPGAFSNHGGRDFAAVLVELSGLAGINPPPCGWGSEGAVLGPEGLVEWASLDAQWFGVAQRRLRVFALADFGDWASRPEILLEPESLRGNPPARGRPGQDVAGTIAGGARKRSGYSADDIPLTGDSAHTLRAEGFDASEDGTGRGTPLVPMISPALKARDHKGPSSDGDGDGDGAPWIPVMHREIAPTLTGNYGKQADSSDTSQGPMLIPTYAIQAGALRENPSSGPDGVGVQAHIAYTLEARAEVQAIAFDSKSSGRNGFGVGEVSPTLRAMGHKDSHSNAGGQVAALQNMRVRRLTPRECERLMGLPDDYTLITYRAKPAADGPRYKALGNSMADPVIYWIGSRIERAAAP